MSQQTTYMSKYNTAKAVRDKEERPLSQLAHCSRQPYAYALMTARHNSAYLLCIPDLLELIY